MRCTQNLIFIVIIKLVSVSLEAHIAHLDYAGISVYSMSAINYTAFVNLFSCIQWHLRAEGSWEK